VCDAFLVLGLAKDWGLFGIGFCWAGVIKFLGRVDKVGVEEGVGELVSG
jgi:hypothetical protein